MSIGNHPISCYLQYDGDWHDVIADVWAMNPVTVSRGGAELSDALKASQVGLTLLDFAGNYRPHNPSSPLYGLAGRNTPLMIGSLVAYEDFEDTTIVVTIGAGASVNPWARSTTNPHTGSWCFKSGATADGAFSDCIITVPAGANTCTLWYRTDCDPGDRLQITSGGQLRLNLGGTGGVWAPVTVPVMTDAAGTKQVYVRYLKDAAGSAGADAVYIDDVRFFTSQAAGEVSGWNPDQDQAFGNGTGRGMRWTGVEAGGLLRRIGQWTDPVISTYGRRLLQEPALVDLWPLDDASGSASLRNTAYPNPGFNRAAQLGTSDAPGGGEATSVALSGGTQVDGVFRRTGANEYTIGISFKVPASNGLSAYPTTTLFLSWATAQNWGVFISLFSGGWELKVNDDHGANVLTNSTLWGAAAPVGSWVNLAVSIGQASATTSSYRMQWTGEGSTVPFLSSGTFTGAPGQPSFWLAFATATGEINGIEAAFVYKIDNATYVLTADFLSAFAGYRGETAGARFLRLLYEQGLHGVLRGKASDTELMGPQRPDTMINLLKEIRDTDAGLLTDFEGGGALAYRTRRNLYNQTPVIAFTFNTNVAPPLTPILDDLHTNNYVTVQNRGGGSATDVDTASAMGTAPPPTGVGLYKQTVDVNVSAVGRLADLASWWLNLGTNPEARYQSVTVDLDNPGGVALESAVDALLPGDRVTITGLDADLIDLCVVGIQDTRSSGGMRRTATLLCVPYRSFGVAVYDNAARRYDSRTSTLNAGYSTTATSMVVKFTDLRDQWSTTAAPYDWAVAGERIRVTAMGAVTGTGPWTQTATVTRSINGVVKAQTAGAAVHMHRDQQARYAL